MERIIVYTDGSCLKNPGRGGWACIINRDYNTTIISGNYPNTTNNRMELMAIIEAIDYLDGKSILIRTDSMYAINGITKWMYNWKKSNWIGVKNIDLFQRLYDLNTRNDVQYEWVKGHSGNEGNEMADYEARKAAMEC